MIFNICSNKPYKILSVVNFIKKKLTKTDNKNEKIYKLEIFIKPTGQIKLKKNTLILNLLNFIQL